MDEPDVDRDIVIQRYSADLIADFDRSLEPFLRKPNGELRTRVRARETWRLVSQVLEPFQELPQLLDPHLPRYLPVLAEAYLERLKARHRTKLLSMRSQLLIPLSDAICQIIYAFCKIRGEKVIVKFLNVESRYLELLLLAFEESERQSETIQDQNPAITWTWKERYVVLLWLSQLFYAPFDLSTMSSGDTDDTDPPAVPGFRWPSKVPGITLRVIPLGIKYLTSPGKETDGAKALLVRLAMRKDMQEIGILRSLVLWAMFTLRPTSDGQVESPYHYIGTLGLLAGILRSSADTSTMDPYLSQIFDAVQAISNGDNPVFAVINGSAVARKTMIKAMRSVILLVLRKQTQSMEEMEMVEGSISYLLESLADNDTPVRFSASKALSMITLKLDPDMAAQVVEAVLDSLNRNVLWVKPSQAGPDAKIRDLAAVDPLEWHGLMLTLSHLIYRRSPPPESLSDIIRALIIGLSFEKRGTSGASIGTNVRDAACFGIWALARRYTTAELLQVEIGPRVPLGVDPASVSILQLLAIELVVSASLDPAGNIRRGSSAALQELIGRHPETVVEGIAVVQTVDYHAVALRSRAIHEVALQATRLSSLYGFALRDALLGWRGIGDMDAAARKVAATSFGTLTMEIVQTSATATDHFSKTVDLLLNKITTLQVRQVEERHGLILSLAAVFDSIPSLLILGRLNNGPSGLPLPRLLDCLVRILEDCTTTTYRKPELIAGAVSQLMVSSYPILLLSTISEEWNGSAIPGCVQRGDIITAENQAHSLAEAKRLIDSNKRGRSDLQRVLSVLQDSITNWLSRNEIEVIETAARAAVILLLFVEADDQRRLVREWSSKVGPTAKSRNRNGNGFLHALTHAYHVVALLPDKSEMIDGFIDALKQRWESEADIDIRVAIVQSLTNRDILRYHISNLVPILTGGLDDYTTNARGDVGSHVRLEAIRATRSLWESFLTEDGSQSVSSDVLQLFPRILRLAAEKLDRVRIEAQAAVSLLLPASDKETLQRLSFSSKEYFVRLFGLCSGNHFTKTVSDHWVMNETECWSNMLAGLVTSADTGNEDLVIASRAAVAQIYKMSANNLSKICTTLIHNLKQHQGQDRVVIPTLELLAYLFHIEAAQKCGDINLRQLCLLTQKACYKTGSVRKIEACIKVYGGIAGADCNGLPDHQVTSELDLKRQEGIAEARRRLGALLIHPWPRVRTLVVDELWSLVSKQSDHAQQLLSVDWGKAEKGTIKKLVEELGFS
ncbi:tubulin folding cofactor D C terminal-domain-containing protein [Xylariales sp. PMI_506]|nr:tubulin folding cofactor D C terminal-domain-containing protein [Xylariales sp. PMI_506]